MSGSDTTATTPSDATQDERVAPDASNHHYALPAQIFELFLDKNLKYSVGLFESEHDSLDDAQIRKLEFIADALHLKPGSRVLDAGCGWGSLSVFLAERGCIVTGITPSPVQADYIAKRAEKAGVTERLDIRRGVFEEQEFSRGTFDAISFVGSIVHMPDKLSVLKRSRELLRKRGRIYLSETCFSSEERYQQYAQGQEHGFIKDEIFGWGDCVPVSRYVAHMESAGLSLVGLKDLTAHYFHTIAEWRRRADKNRDAIDRIRPGYTDTLIRYFDLCNTSWGYTTKQYALIAARDRGRHLPTKKSETLGSNGA